jgi:hypothetical protein
MCKLYYTPFSSEEEERESMFRVAQTHQQLLWLKPVYLVDPDLVPIQYLESVRHICRGVINGNAYLLGMVGGLENLEQH